MQQEDGMAKRPWHQVPDAVRLLIAEYVRSHTHGTTSHVDYAELTALLEKEGHSRVHNLEAAVKRERRRQGVQGIDGRRPKPPSPAHQLVLQYIADGKRSSSSYGIVDYAKIAKALAEIGFHDKTPKYTRIVHLVRWAREKLGYKALPKGKHLRTERTIEKQRTFMTGRKLGPRQPDVLVVALRTCIGLRNHTICLNDAQEGKAFCEECLKLVRAHNARRRPVLESSGN